MSQLNRLKALIGIGNRGIFAILVFFVTWVLIIVLSGAGINPLNVEWDFENPGAFGDSFGPLSAIMASIAALSAIAAYRAQSKEILRLKERQETEDRIAIKERSKLEKRQKDLDKKVEIRSFEDTFFKLLDSFRGLVSQIDIRLKNGSTKKAHDAFESMVRFTDSAAISQQGNIGLSWNQTIKEYRNDLNHYFRFMYHIIRFVDESNTPKKYFYVRFVRAMLSESEIILLGLNCEYGDGREKFYPFVKKYGLLHNISPDSRIRWFGRTNMDAHVFESE